MPMLPSFITARSVATNSPWHTVVSVSDAPVRFATGLSDMGKLYSVIGATARSFSSSVSGLAVM